MIRLVLIFLLFASYAYPQVGNVVQHDSITGLTGINTKDGDFVIRPNESRACHNFDLLRYGAGSLGKRLGYDSMSSLSISYDSMPFIFGAKLSNGLQYLAFVADSARVGYGGVYVTANGSTDLTLGATKSKRILDHWSIQEPTYTALFRDQLYGVNGTQKGFVWNGSVCRSWPLNAPGEPRITPMAMPFDSTYYTNTVYKLNGEYRYMMRAIYIDTAKNKNIAYEGMISGQVVVKNGRTYIDQLQYIQPQRGINQVDSMRFVFYRTKANRSPLDENDTLYRLRDSLVNVTTANIATKTIIDSIPDDSLSATGLRKVNQATSWYGLDSLGIYLARYGAPAFDTSFDSTYYPAGDTFGRGGIYYGIPTQKDTLGVAYMCTFMDTVLAIESDSGRTLFVYTDSTNKAAHKYHRHITLQLPKIPSGQTGAIINLYRAHILSIGHDTTLKIIGRETTTVYPENGGIPYTRITQKIKYLDAFSPDTVILDGYYLVAQIPSTDTIYTDSLRYDSLYRFHRPFDREPPPTRMKKVFTHKDRMFGFQGSRLYVSKLDSVSNWGVFRSVPLNEDDGDEIVDAWPTRTAIVVKKNKTSWNVWEDENGEWKRREIVSYVGDIARGSHAANYNGNYYLSDIGVIHETDGEVIERTFVPTLASEKLDNFDKLNINTKSAAVGFALPHKYLLCIGDTTYVYFEPRGDGTFPGGWATWSMPFRSATMYGYSASFNSYPFDTMFFVRAGGRTLFRYGKAEYDNSTVTPQVVYYESGPLLTSTSFKKIVGLGIWTRSGSVASTVEYGFYNQNDSVITTAIMIMDSLNQRYRAKKIETNPAQYCRLVFRSLSIGWLFHIGAIDRFDIYWREYEDYRMR